jgi:hypothetical protein
MKWSRNEMEVTSKTRNLETSRNAPVGFLIILEGFQEAGDEPAIEKPGLSFFTRVGMMARVGREVYRQLPNLIKKITACRLVKRR